MREQAENELTVVTTAKALDKPKTHLVFYIGRVSELLAQLGQAVNTLKNVPHGFVTVNEKKAFSGDAPGSVPGRRKNTIPPVKHRKICDSGCHQLGLASLLEFHLPKCAWLYP